MAVFNEFEEMSDFNGGLGYESVQKDGHDIGFRLINDLKTYKPTPGYFELLIVVDGNALYVENGEKKVISPRTVGFFFPKETNRFVSDRGARAVCYSVLISPYLLTELCNLVNHKAMDILFSGEGHMLFRMQYRDFEYFLHNAELAISADKEVSLVLAKRVAYNLISQLVLSINERPTYPDWFEQFLGKIHQPECFLSPMSEIYKLAPYSQPMLNSYFNRFMGETLVSYITKMKINYACNLLRFSTLPVVDIATKTKYSSLSHFNHIFKKHMSMTPSEYRANNYISGDIGDESK